MSTDDPRGQFLAGVCRVCGLPIERVPTVGWLHGALPGHHDDPLPCDHPTRPGAFTQGAWSWPGPSRKVPPV